MEELKEENAYKELEYAELKIRATELGLDFKGNIKKEDLQKIVNDELGRLAIEGSKNAAAEHSKLEKIKVIITPRDDNEKEGFVGLNGYKAQFQFDEEIELPVDVVEFLKSKGGNVYKPTRDSQGNTVMEAKWQSRYIIEKV